MASSFDLKLMREMHEAGYKDWQIAMVVGCSLRTVGAWKWLTGRKANSLVAKHAAEVKRLWAAGLTDPKIGEKLGIKARHVCYLRKIQGLESKYWRSNRG